MDLHYTCESLFSNKDSPEQYDNILTQFFNATNFDEITISAFVIDSDFPTLIQCILFPMMRYAIPSPSEGKPQKIVFECLHFLTQLSYTNPYILNIIAANVPFDTLIKMFFENFNGSNDVENGGGSILIPVLKFLSILSTSRDVKLENVDSISLLFDTLSLIYSIPEVSHLSVSTAAGFIHNAPTAMAYIKHTTDLVTLKNQIGDQLTSDDPAIVMSAICLLTLLFPSQVTPKTAFNVAISSMSTQSTPLVPFLAATTILELAELVEITTNEIAYLLKAAMNGGFSAYIIYNLLIDLASFHEVIIKTIHETNCFFTLIDTMLDAQNGFVSIAGAHFISFYFQHKEDYVYSSDVVEPFEKALKIAMTSPKYKTFEQREASIILMRNMIKAPEAVTYVLSTIQQHEEDLFIDFQRQTELNNSYISLQYFLLIYECSDFLPHFKTKLIDAIADTPFSALLVHVLSDARNRIALTDALRAHYIVASGLQEDIPSQNSPFFESVVSSLLLLNTQRYIERTTAKARLAAIITDYQQKIVAVEAIRDQTEAELQVFQAESSENSSMLKQHIKEKKLVNDENIRLQSSIKRMQVQIKKYKEDFATADEENVMLQAKVKNMEELAVGVKEVQTNFRERLLAYTAAESKLKKTKADNEQLIAELKNQNRLFDKEKKKTDGYKRRYDTLKQEIQGYKTQAKEMQEKLDILKEDCGKLSEKCEETQRKVKAHQDMDSKRDTTQNAVIEQLKEEIEQAKHDQELSQRRIDDKLSVVNQVQERITTLEQQIGYFNMLIRLIHKSTAGPDALPKEAIKFMKKQK